jgi:ketosteroid isomerase-like protein
MERAEIAELLYDTLVSCGDVEQLFRFLSPRVEWMLSAADPQNAE